MEVIINDGEHNKIHEVVVFTDQAYIKRQAEAEAVSGLNRFLLELNAFYIDQDSIQANVFAPGEILSVQYLTIPVTEMTQENIRELEQQLRQLKQKKKVLLRDQESINKQKQFLDSSVAYAQTEIPKKLKTDFPTPDNLQNILTFLEQNFKQLNEKQTVLEEQLEELEDKLTLTERKIKQQKKPEKAHKQFIEIVFMAQQQKNIQMEVFYIAGQASWQPVYKVDVSADLSAINLSSFAQIEQTTGENWQDIKLSVSNAIPLKGSKLPDQKSWTLHLSSTQIPIVNNGGLDEVLFAGAMPIAASYEMEAELLDEPAPASYAQSERKELPLAFEFILPQRVDIGHGNTESLLPIGNEKITGKFFHLCMPQQDVLVYLVCEALIENTLLAGKLNIYFSGRFVASTYLEEKRPGQQLLLNLGAERDIKVSREKLTDKLSDSFFGVVDRLSAVRELVYRITIENLKNKNINIHIIDAVPVSSSDRIQIKNLQFKPEPDIKQWQDREGVMLWDMTLAEKTTQEIKMSLFVKHPKDDAPYELL